MTYPYPYKSTDGSSDTIVIPNLVVSEPIVNTSLTLGAPTFATRSVGTRLVEFDNLDASHAGYAIGVQSGAQWYGVDTATNSHIFYGGVTEQTRINNQGLSTNSGSSYMKYSEGTWTPTIYDPTDSVTYNGGNFGYYVKVGKMVTYTVYCNFNTVGILFDSAYEIRLLGLPFPPVSDVWSANLNGQFSTISNLTGPLFIQGKTPNLVVFSTGGDGGIETASNTTNNQVIAGTFTFQTT